MPWKKSGPQGTAPSLSRRGGPPSATITSSSTSGEFPRSGRRSARWSSTRRTACSFREGREAPPPGEGGSSRPCPPPPPGGPCPGGRTPFPGGGGEPLVRSLLSVRAAVEGTIAAGKGPEERRSRGRGRGRTGSTTARKGGKRDGAGQE